MVVLEEIDRNNTFSLRSGLEPETPYLLEVEGLDIFITPPSTGWELLGYLASGSQSGALLAWDGPSGFRSETLNVLIWDVEDDGLEAAWSRVSAWLEAGVSYSEGGGYAWLADGFGSIAGIEAEWREVRSSDTEWPDNTWHGFAPFLAAVLFADTSARFYVVPVGDLTVTLVGYETRCACQARQNPEDRSPRRGQRSDDTENELSMWIPELEAFLAAMSFEAP